MYSNNWVYFPVKISWIRTNKLIRKWNERSCGWVLLLPLVISVDWRRKPTGLTWRMLTKCVISPHGMCEVLLFNCPEIMLNLNGWNAIWSTKISLTLGSNIVIVICCCCYRANNLQNISSGFNLNVLAFRVVTVPATNNRVVVHFLIVLNAICSVLQYSTQLVFLISTFFTLIVIIAFNR